MFSRSVTGVTRDPDLPALAEVLNTERLVTLLGLATGLDLEGRDVSCDAQVLNHKLGVRCTIRFTMGYSGELGQPRREVKVIGKVYGRQLHAERLYCRTQDLRAGAFNDSGPLRVPAPMMLVQDLGLVLQEYIDGTDLRNVLAIADDGPLTLAGRWLARLHAAPALHGLKIAAMLHELEKADRWCDYIKPSLTTSGSQRLDRARDTLHRLAAEITPCTPVMIHKDFYHGNLLWDGRWIWGLDFDELAMGDPALDVGHFLAHLEILAYRRMQRVNASARAITAFFRSYQTHSSLDVESRLPLYKAYTFLKLAATEVSRQSLHWQRIARVLAALACREVERALPNEPSVCHAISHEPFDVNTLGERARPSARRHAGALWAITCYFNPVGYKRRLENYHTFRRHLSVPLLTVELSFDEHFQLRDDDADVLVQLQGASVMWQKERLLNVALTLVPDACEYVAWLDCDVVFESADWVERAQRALNRFTLLRLFHQRHDLSLNVPVDQVLSQIIPENSFLDLVQRIQHCRSPGLAWASRRDLLEKHGLYDACILGSGDRAILYAALGQFDDATRVLRLKTRRLDHYLAWATPFFDSVQRRVGSIHGRLFHLWHGERNHRDYRERHGLLEAFDFDPHTDIAIDGNGCWRWNSGKRDLHNAVRRYFESRREDGVAAPPT